MHDDVFHSCAPDMVNSSEQDPMFHHLWVVGSVCRFPMPLLKQCHAAMGMDIRERLARNSPEAIVRAYSYQGVVVPLLLCPMFFVFFGGKKHCPWYRACQNRVVAMIQEYRPEPTDIPFMEWKPPTTAFSVSVPFDVLCSDAFILSMHMFPRSECGTIV